MGGNKSDFSVGDSGLGLSQGLSKRPRAVRSGGDALSSAKRLNAGRREINCLHRAAVRHDQRPRMAGDEVVASSDGEYD